MMNLALSSSSKSTNNSTTTMTATTTSRATTTTTTTTSGSSSCRNNNRERSDSNDNKLTNNANNGVAVSSIAALLVALLLLLLLVFVGTAAAAAATAKATTTKETTPTTTSEATELHRQRREEETRRLATTASRRRRRRRRRLSSSWSSSSPSSSGLAVAAAAADAAAAAADDDDNNDDDIYSNSNTVAESTRRRTVDAGIDVDVDDNKNEIDLSEQRIYHGRSSRRGEFPFFVLANGCGGTLVWQDVVVTAAHCYGPFRRDAVVFVGAVAYASDAHGAERRVVRQFVKHPSSDLAVVLLKTSSRKRTAVLNRNDAYPRGNQKLRVVGFGRTQNSGRSSRLQQTFVSAVPTRACKQRYWSTLKPAYEFCASQKYSATWYVVVVVAN